MKDTKGQADVGNAATGHPRGGAWPTRRTWAPCRRGGGRDARAGEPEPRAVAKAQKIEASGEPKFLATPVLYEIMTGLLHRRSRTETNRFRRAVSRFIILPFDEHAARTAAEIQAELLRLGRRCSDIDVMIAGIAAHHGHVLVCRDEKLADLDIAGGLEVQPY